MFETICGWYHIYYLIVSKIGVCTTSYRLFNVPGEKWLHQQKGQHIFKIYVVNVPKLNLNLLCVKFALNWTNIKRIRKGVPVAPSNPTYFTSQKTNFSRVPELTCLKLSWITITITSLKMFQCNISFEILFKGVIVIPNWCSILNNTKVPVKLEPSVKNEAINYLSPMKANG